MGDMPIYHQFSLDHTLFLPHLLKYLLVVWSLRVLDLQQPISSLVFHPGFNPKHRLTHMAASHRCLHTLLHLKNSNPRKFLPHCSTLSDFQVRKIQSKLRSTYIYLHINRKAKSKRSREWRLRNWALKSQYGLLELLEGICCHRQVCAIFSMRDFRTVCEIRNLGLFNVPLVIVTWKNTIGFVQWDVNRRFWGVVQNAHQWNRMSGRAS